MVPKAEAPLVAGAVDAALEAEPVVDELVPVLRVEVDETDVISALELEATGVTDLGGLVGIRGRDVVAAGTEDATGLTA